MSSQEECNDDTKKGHNWCLITSNLQISQSDEIPTIKNEISQIVKTEKYFSGIYVKPEITPIPNFLIQYPTAKKLEEDPSYVITGIEVAVNSSVILEITAVYYTSLQNILSRIDIRAYTEEINPYFGDSIKEYYRDDIVDQDGFQIGFYDSNSTKYLIVPPKYGGFALTGYEFVGDGFSSVKQLLFHFTSFINPTKTHSILVRDGNITNNFLGNLSGNNLWSFYSPPNSYIQSINIAYTPDLIDRSKRKNSTRQGEPPDFMKNIIDVISPFYSVTVKQYGVGMKGIVNSTYITYPSDVYKWIREVDDIKCCQLVEEEQYEDKTLEKDMCVYARDLTTRNEFPLIIPNDKCNEILQSNLSTDNIDSDLYKNYCKLTYSDCDSTIQQYCDKKYTITESGKLDLENMYKDPVCGCYSNYDIPNPQTSYHSSLDLVIGDKAGEQIQIPSRFECTAPICVNSPYKFKNMKDRLSRKECTSLESCFGKGYFVPYYKGGNEIDCIKYENDNSCIPPYRPNYEFLANPFDRSCEETLKNVKIKEFLTKECELSRDEYENCGTCGQNNKMYCKRQVRKEGYPITNCENPQVRVNCKYTNYKLLIVFIGFIFVIIIMLIIILKKIKK